MCGDLRDVGGKKKTPNLKTTGRLEGRSSRLGKATYLAREKNGGENNQWESEKTTELKAECSQKGEPADRQQDNVDSSLRK